MKTPGVLHRLAKNVLGLRKTGVTPSYLPASCPLWTVVGA